MGNALWEFFLAGVDWANVELKILYEKLTKLMLICIGVIIVQWMINAAGAPGVNLLFFFGGGALLAFLLFAPLNLAAAGFVGAVYAFFQDTDISQGTIGGIKWYMKVVVGIIFGWWVITGLLATWSFQENPWAFWYVAAAACIIFALTIVFGWNSKVFPFVVFLYALGVVLLGFSSTLPGFNEWKNRAKETMNPFAQSTATANGTAATVVQEEITEFRHGITVNLSPTIWTKFLFTGSLSCRTDTHVGLGPYDREVLTEVVGSPAPTAIRLRAKTTTGSQVRLTESPTRPDGTC